MTDNLSNEQEPQPSPVKRPGGLTLICILTFIFSGLLFFSSFFYSLYYAYLPELIQSSPFTKAFSGIEGLEEAMKALTEVNRWFYISNTLLYAVSVAGAIMMFRLKKVGFHLYTVAQILLLIVPLVYIPGFKTDIPNITITTVFILIYATHLRIMK